MTAPAKLTEYAALIEEELTRFFRDPAGVPPRLMEAMAYSARGGGKRFRGALAMGACAAVGGRPVEALPSACALEMVHAFSLIHDDLPCMDDSDLRRGKPTNHRIYGEALALLAGDGLLIWGVQILRRGALYLGPERALAAVEVLLDALGPAGMIGGQVLDMEAEHIGLDLDALRALDAAKTGALIRAAARIGALVGGGSSAEQEALDAYATSLGLAFQITDDLLDLTGNAAAMGKPTGCDKANAKATYPSLLGPAEARAWADKEIAKSLAQIAIFGERGTFLADLAGYVLSRDR